MPLISVVTIVYNGVAHLEETILSVLHQPYKNVEYIVIDGGSTDGSVALLKRYEDAIDYWVSEADHGIADAFNKGLSLCHGEWIGLLNADDYYTEQTLQVIATENRGGVICGRLKFLEGEQSFETKSVPKLLPRMMSVNHPTTFVRSRVYDQYGPFDTTFSLAMDYELLLRLFLHNIEFIAKDETLAVMRMGGVSDRQYRDSLWEVYRAKRKHGLSLPSSFATFLGQYSRSLTTSLFNKAGLDFAVRFYRQHFIKINRKYL